LINEAIQTRYINVTWEVRYRQSIRYTDLITRNKVLL